VITLGRLSVAGVSRFPMPQIFHRSTNTISKVSLFGALLFIVAVAGISWKVYRSPWMTEALVAKEQPIPFSHEHHVGALGIDCRFCHTSVEDAPFAGMPATKTCMGCHSRIWIDSPMLEPVRQSARTGEPIRWVRVHDVPDFAVFDHSAHVAGGVGCSTCHGRIDAMPLTWQTSSLHMRWCLDCHRQPQRHIRPRAQVFDMAWSPPPASDGPDAAAAPAHLMDCNTCHR